MSESPDETAAAEENWIAERRAEVTEYLAGQGLQHGEIGEWPAWHIPHQISVWAVESLKAPGWVGWWAICGDGPADYCSASVGRHPRLAIKAFAANWRAAANDPKPDDTLGETGLPAHLASLLLARADFLDGVVSDEVFWADERWQ